MYSQRLIKHDWNAAIRRAWARPRVRSSAHAQERLMKPSHGLKMYVLVDTLNGQMANTNKTDTQMH